MRSSNYLNLDGIGLDTYIYRVISVERLVELYTDKINSLCKPSSWDDPFENFILKSKVKDSSGNILDYGFHKHFYGQCWTLHKASDAMWRIYAPDKKGVRIRTTIKKLASSLYNSGVNKPDATCYLGKVRYLRQKKMLAFANTVYDDSGVSVDNIFHSLLVKRPAFKHEREIRLLYSDVTKSPTDERFTYTINPNDLIDQLLLDPRLSYADFISLKESIRDKTGATCKIKRSMLYTAPEEVILNVNKA